MKKLFILFVIPILGLAQKSDTLINNGVYESLYSYKLGQPIYVKYKLYKGGGDCSRRKEGFRFKKDSIIPHISASDIDYEASGYDRGHMANAEDFAYDCIKEEVTFRYYNSIPQNPKLNRGIWKTNETKIREISQTDSLLIFCGGIFTKKSIPIKERSQLIVPTYCYKIVISLTTHKLIMAFIYDNNAEPKEKAITLEDLQGQIHFFFERKIGFSIN